MIEAVLDDGETFIIGITNSDTSEIKATVVWTDPPGIPPLPSLDPQDTMLINNLDLRIVDFTDSAVSHPWKLDKDNPSSAATNDSENDVDNVEMVLVGEPSPETSYSLIVDHDGSLQNGSQAFSLIISFDGEVIEPPESDFDADNTSPTIYDTVRFYDQSENFPEKWEWSFYPDQVTFLNGTDASSQNPQTRFDSTGLYNVSLTTWNAGGSSNENKLDFITAYNVLVVEAFANPDKLCIGDSCYLESIADGGSGEYNWSWHSIPEGFNSDEQNPVAAPDQTTIFIIEVNDGIQTASDSITVEVFTLPEITLGDWPDQLCNEDEPPVQLTAIPEGGIYIGVSVTPDGLFNPEEAPLGWNVITYTYQDENNCINFAFDSIHVNDCVGLLTITKDTDVKIFPNPCSGEFFIESRYTIEKAELFDQYGVLRNSVQSNLNKIKVSGSLESGLYFIRINFRNGYRSEVVHRKVIVR